MIAATSHDGGHGGGATGFLVRPSFDYVEFGSGEEAVRYEFEAFRALSLSTRVKLLLSTPPRFFLDGREIPHSQAMRFQG